MILGDTIAALASAPGTAPRAIVRLSGPRTHAALRSMIDSPPRERGATTVRIALPDLPATIPGVLVRYVAPASYTGEDGAELIVPGGAHIARLVMNALLQTDGVRRATPGEFTVRALTAGKLDPEQAESVGALIAARSESELGAAHRVLSGVSGSAYRTIIESLAHALALVEAGIDFSDHEDVVAIAPADLLDRLAEIGSQLGALVSRSAASEHSASGGALVVIAGPPNAGKSTLLNRLAGWERAIVSDTPGTTRDVIEEVIDLYPGKVRVRLADTAGIDASITGASRAEAAGQEQSAGAIERAGVVVWCDPSGGFDGAPEGAILVRTKCDLPHERDPDDVIDVCALDRRGVHALEEAIAERALEAAPSGEWSVLPRHHEALSTALRCVEDARGLIDPAEEMHDPELVAQCMRSAMDELGRVVGDITPDDIIGRIRSTFCVGK